MPILTSIVAWTALIVAGFAILHTTMIINDIIKKNNTSENHINNDTPSDGYSDDFKNGWSQATEFMIMSIKITMYDLYRTHDVLDFETNTNEFIERFNLILDNVEYRSEAIREYDDYMKGRE